MLPDSFKRHNGLRRLGQTKHPSKQTKKSTSHLYFSVVFPRWHHWQRYINRKQRKTFFLLPYDYHPNQPSPPPSLSLSFPVGRVMFIVVLLC